MKHFRKWKKLYTTLFYIRKLIQSFYEEYVYSFPAKITLNLAISFRFNVTISVIRK